MGTISQQIGLSDALFTKTQQRVLGPLFGNPGRSYYANELVRLAGGGTGAVLRELDKLRSAGLITLTQVGNQKHYQANASSPLFDELVSIVRKTFGLGEGLRRALAPMAARIDVAFVYGSVAAGADRATSDIDLFLIGRGLSYADVMRALGDDEASLGRKVNPTVYSPDELARKLEDGSSFLRRVLDQPKLFLIGSERELVVQATAISDPIAVMLDDVVIREGDPASNGSSGLGMYVDGPDLASAVLSRVAIDGAYNVGLQLNRRVTVTAQDLSSWA